MLIAARDNGFRVKDQEQIVLDTVEGYRTAMRGFAGRKNLEVWYSHLDIEQRINELAPQFAQRQVKRTERLVAKARTKDSMAAFSKLTEIVDGRARIVDESPLIVPLRVLAPGETGEQIFERLHGLIRVYRDTLEFDRRVLLEEFELIDFARKVVGVGSVGTRAWIVLLMGLDGQDPLFLQMKEAEPGRDRFLRGSSFDRAIVNFSGAYADQNERDYHELVKAVQAGRITAETGL